MGQLSGNGEQDTAGEIVRHDEQFGGAGLATKGGIVSHD